MGRRKRKRASRGNFDVRSLSGEELAQKLSELLEGGKYQRSIELGKEIRRRGLLDRHADLIERAYRLRARELASKDLYRESAVIVENAMSCGVLSDGLVDLGVRCYLATGRLDDARWIIGQAEGAGADATAVSHLLADLAILALPVRSTAEPGETETKEVATNAVSPEDPEPAFALEPELAADLRRLERAFRSYESGLDDEARTELAGIARRSALARWRLLLGGLMARATRDFATARSCWERIPSRGPCGMIARGLLDELSADQMRSVSSGARATATPAGDPDPPAPEPSRAEADPDVPLKLSLSQDARLRLLEDIAECCRDGDESALVLAVQTAVNTWPGGLSSRERARLFRAIGGASEPSPMLHRRLRTYLGDLPENQLGLRQAALVAEREDAEYAHMLWDEYLDGIDDVGLEPRLVPRARALILERMGDIARDKPRASCVLMPGVYVDFDADDLDPGAVECYRRSIGLDPGNIAVRRKLAALLRETGETRDAEQVLEELLALVPSDVGTFLDLAESAYARKSYKKAFKYFEGAYRLEPLNSRVQTKLSECLDASACRRAAKGRYDLARKDWERAVEVWHGSPPADLLIRWSAVEAAGGERERSEEVFRRALETGIWRAEAELKMVNALARLNVDEGFYTARRDAFVELVREAPKDAASVESLARIHGTVIGLAGSDRHFSKVEKMLHKHLRKASRVPLEPGPGLELCRLFAERGLFDLALAYAAAGRERFPEEPRFVLHEAEACLELGRDPGMSLRNALDRAISETAENGDLSLAERLAHVRDLSAWLPRRRRKPRRSASVFDKIFADIFDDDTGMFDDETEIDAREREIPF